MGYDPSVANAWAQAYGNPAPLPQAQAMGSNVLAGYAAPATTNYGNLSGGIGQDVLQRMQGTQMWDPSGGDGSTGSWGWEGGQPIYGSDPNGNPLPVTYSPKTLVYHPQGQGVGEQYPTFDPVTGEFKGYQTGSKVQSYASGVLSVLGAAAGMGAAFGGAGAVGTTGYASGGLAGGGGAGAGVAAGGAAGAAPMSQYGVLDTGAANLSAAGGAAGGVAPMSQYGVLDNGAANLSASGYGSAPMSQFGVLDNNAARLSAQGGFGGTSAVPPPVGGGGGGSGSSPSPAARSGLSSFTNPDGSFNWGSLIGPATQLAGGYLSANAASNASHDQLTAAREAAAMFEPWRQAGAWGIGQAANMAGKNGPDAATAAFQQDPGYQFRLDQGNQALTRAAAASGGLGSGKYLKDAMTYNQGQASQEFGNSYNRLMALAGMGQTATGSAADYTTQGANAQAAGTVGRANAYNNALTQGYGMYQQNQMVNRLFPSGSY